MRWRGSRRTLWRLSAVPLIGMGNGEWLSEVEQFSNNTWSTAKTISSGGLPSYVHIDRHTHSEQLSKRPMHDGSPVRLRLSCGWQRQAHSTELISDWQFSQDCNAEFRGFLASSITHFPQSHHLTDSRASQAASDLRWRFHGWNHQWDQQAGRTDL